MKTLILTLIRAFAVLVGLTAVVLCHGLFTFNAPPFPLSRLEQLEPGMSQAAVENVLGKPRSAYSDGNRQTWAYCRVLSWPIVCVYFDEDGKMTRMDYDY